MCATDRLPVDRMQQRQASNTQNEDKNKKHVYTESAQSEMETKPPVEERKQCEQGRDKGQAQKGETQAA